MSSRVDTRNKDVKTVIIPSSLRTIAPFLEEAQSALRRKGTPEKNKVAVFCIDHALKLVTKFGLTIDSDAEQTLKLFHLERDMLARPFGLPDLTAEAVAALRVGNIVNSAAKDISPEDILIAEGTATLELANQQYEEIDVNAAARNYHTAAVYYRVLESMVPRLTSRVHDSLVYASSRTLLTSKVHENLIHEHFEGLRCVDFYEIIETKKLGKGSYGSVYLCKHRKTGDEYACKVIGMNRINSHYLRKLHMEICIMKEVDHPQIIKLREVFFGSRTVYLVMELCKGGELFDEITHNAQRGLPESHAAKLLVDMFSSVKYLHKQNIAHRDLKLENFLFEQPGMHSPLKLIDFGLSKHFEAGELMHQVVGSAYYTAPEVLSGEYDQRCDVWSLGVIAYMLLSGAPPFNGDSSEKIHNLILNKEPDFGQKMFPKVHPTTLDFLKQLLTKDPNKRITIDAAFKHPFLQKGLASPSALNPIVTPAPDMAMEIAQSLIKFSKLSIAKKLILEAVAFSLSATQINSLRLEFNLIDLDRNGKLSLSEIHGYVMKYSGEDYINNNPNLSGISGNALSAFKARNSNELGENGIPFTDMTYLQFTAAIMCKRFDIDDNRLILAFQALDTESKGMLNLETLRHSLGFKGTDKDVHDLLDEIDLNRNGEITLDEFQKYWKNYTASLNLTPLDKFKRAVKNVSMGLAAVRMMKGNRSISPHDSRNASLDTPNTHRQESSYLAVDGSVSPRLEEDSNNSNNKGHIPRIGGSSGVPTVTLGMYEKGAGLTKNSIQQSHISTPLRAYSLMPEHNSTIPYRLGSVDPTSLQALAAGGGPGPGPGGVDKESEFSDGLQPSMAIEKEKVRL